MAEVDEERIEDRDVERKPDYTDMDWSFLIKDRVEKWASLLDEVRALGWEVRPLREEAGFTSQLIFLPRHEEKRGMLIVCAGGGFMFKSANEAKPVAEFFHRAGLNTAILDYHVDSTRPMGQNDDVRLAAGRDGLAAVRYVRAHAEALGVFADKIAIGGFSAGGMVSAFTATMFDAGDAGAEDPVLRVSSRPDAALILYGAFSQSGLGGDGVGMYDCATQAGKAQVDPLRNIRWDCPPMFVFQTHKDDPRIALNFCMELANYGVPYEIHTFEDGPHGGALYDGSCEDSPLFEHTSRWAELAAEWLVMRGF